MYYVQTKAPAGNFTDYMGTQDANTAADTRKYLIEKGEVSRVVIRVDKVFIGENKPSRKRKVA